MERFREMGISPASRLGQNFLIDLNLHRVIIDAADLSDRDVVLEVGAGTGALTQLIAQSAAAVVSVEIDAHLFELASELLVGHPNVTMLRLDALKNKNTFNPLVLDAVGRHLNAEPGRRLKLVANLPYNIATPVLSNLLLCEYTPHSMVATIQKELAERIVAQPWSKNYGALSVWMQCQAGVEIVRDMSPSVFWPAPKVNSSIVRIVVDLNRRNAIPNLRYFHQFIKAIFLHRRKYLRANLVSAMKGRLEKPALDDMLSALRLAPDARAEQLDISMLRQLTELVRERAPDWTMS